MLFIVLLLTKLYYYSLLYSQFNMTCLVPGCKSNYSDKDEYISVFSFPTDVETREKWFRAIPRPREDYEMNKRLKVLCHNMFFYFYIIFYV